MSILNFERQSQTIWPQQGGTLAGSKFETTLHALLSFSLREELDFHLRFSNQKSFSTSRDTFGQKGSYLSREALKGHHTEKDTPSNGIYLDQIDENLFSIVGDYKFASKLDLHSKDVNSL